MMIKALSRCTQSKHKLNHSGAVTGPATRWGNKAQVRRTATNGEKEQANRDGAGAEGCRDHCLPQSSPGPHCPAWKRKHVHYCKDTSPSSLLMFVTGPVRVLKSHLALGSTELHRLETPVTTGNLTEGFPKRDTAQ